jgi:hypothetical protein
MREDPEAIRQDMEGRSTEELTSILRNHDEEEWLPVVFEIVEQILTARGLSVSEIKAMGPEPREEPQGDPTGEGLVTVGRFFNSAMAHAARLALEQAGIDALVADEHLGTVYGVAVGARVQVRAGDEAAARAVLEQEPASASQLPPEIAEGPCPKCGSAEVTQSAEVVESLSAPGEGRAWRYECLSCGHTWSEGADQ